MENTEIFKNFTELERKVMVFALEECLYEYCTSVEDISERLDMNINTVKGVVGSLVKKFVMRAETDKRGGEIFHDLFPRSEDDYEVAYGCENLEVEVVDGIKRWIANN